MSNEILDTGISIVYEPPSGLPIVDIVIVHGLHGHPYKSWTSKSAIATKSPQVSPEAQADGPQSGLRKLSWRSTRSTPADGNEKPKDKHATENNNPELETVYWPRDLLPGECPDARILVFGYDSKVTKYLSGPTNKGTLLAHGKDLLFSLCRERIIGRPLVFVAHSLGGIVVKEVLAQSSTSADSALKDVVESTAAVMFLGTPHRGSPDLAALGEYVRSIASTFRIDTTPALLDALGLKTTDLQRAQESFSVIWQKYDFQVKTFQEGLPMTKLGLGALATKIVPDHSSSLGDHRERAETLQANHKEICRFSGDGDPNYRKVAGEFRSIYSSIQTLTVETVSHQVREQLCAPYLKDLPSIEGAQLTGDDHLGDDETRTLKWLYSPGLHARYHGIDRPADKTCSWLFDHQLYQNWLNEENQDDHCGLLWIKGNPGTGKSVLMKEAFHQASRDDTDPERLTAGYFFNAKGKQLERSVMGFWKSLLYQLILRDRENLSKLCSVLRDKGINEDCNDTKNWEEEDFQSFFRMAFTQSGTRSIFIFIDALDECYADSVRHQAYFWRDMTMMARGNGVGLNVCLSSRHFPSITLNNCPEIVMEAHNQHDIALYVAQKFRLGIATEESQWELLRDRILQKSAGIFLWAVLVVEEILSRWDEGENIRSLLKQVDTIPQALQELFTQMLSSLDPVAMQLTLRLFQWAVLTTKPMRIYEWYHILAFIQESPPSSLADWRTSDSFVENGDQLERRIRSISKGLLEVKRDRADDAQDKASDTSVIARAGSLSLEAGDTRVVQVIHESVREFFLLGQGFHVLDHRPNVNLIGDGHLFILRSCVDYLKIRELDAFVQARAQTKGHQTVRQDNNSKPGNFGFHSVDPSRKLNDSQADSQVAARQAKVSANEKPVLETLLASPELEAVVDISRWQEMSQAALGDASSAGSTRHSVMYSSVSGQSQMLEDFPALLSYATLEMFSHALAAQSEKMDPSTVIASLLDQNSWARVVALREDFPKGARVYDCATKFGLHSWLPLLKDKEVDNLEKPLSPRSGHSGEKGRKRSRGRTIDGTSVLSFTSAGTHRESSFYTRRAYSDDSGLEKPSIDPNLVLRPDEGLEDDFIIEDNPFAFSPGQLNMLVNPTSLSVFASLGGLDGIVYGLQSDIKAGLSLDETTVQHKVTFAEATGSKEERSSLAIRVYDSAARPFQDRTRVFQRNALPPMKTAKWWHLPHASDKRSWIALAILAVISVALGIYQTLVKDKPLRRMDSARWADMITVCTTIAIILVMDALYGRYNEKIFSKVRENINYVNVKVVRSGRTAKIDGSDVVVGDILHLEPGDIAPVDGICVESFGLKCDESAATGESDLLLKSDGQKVMRALKAGLVRPMDPFIVSGTKIVEGIGKYICTSVGIHSSLGKLLSSISGPLDGFRDPYQPQLVTLKAHLKTFGGVTAGLLFSILCIRFLANLPHDSRSAIEKAHSFVGIILLSLAIFRLCIPGKPLSAFPLAFASSKMRRDGILIKPEQPCETIGNITTICSNLTGTLTSGQMTVVAARFGSSNFFKTDQEIGRRQTDSPWPPDLRPSLKEILVEAISINSLSYEREEYLGAGYGGSSTENALLQYARDYFDLHDLEETRANFEIVQRIPFRLCDRYAGTLVKKAHGYRLYITGASDTVLNWCTTTMDDELDQVPMLEDRKDSIMETIVQYGTQSLRIIGIAYTDFEKWPMDDTGYGRNRKSHIASFLHGLTLVGVIGMCNPLMEGVPKAVASAQSAGVVVRLVTGESAATARAIASECGILTGSGIVLEGPTFRALSEEDMCVAIPKLQVLARASQEDKRVLLNWLKARGETVALSDNNGDAAPALKTASVSFSHGIYGDQVAKDASSMMLIFDGFTSIVRAVMWGRTINDGIRRSLQFQLTGTIAAAVLIFVTAIADEDLEPVIGLPQLLWIYLVSNPFAALALATNPTSDKIQRRGPESNKKSMWRMIIGQFVYQLTVGLVMYFAGGRIMGYDTSSPNVKTELNTIIFNTFAWMQIFNIFNNRRLDNHFNIFEGIHRDIFLIGVVGLTAGLQVVIIMFGSIAFQVHPGGLDKTQWAICVISASVCLLWGALIRLIPDPWVYAISKPFVKIFRKFKCLYYLSRSPEGE